MLKKLLLTSVSLCWVSIANANAQTASVYTYVTVTNNTNENIIIHPKLTTTDNNFKDWAGDEQTLKPYETKRVLKFSRNQNLKAQQTYRFDITASNIDYQGSDVVMRITETGKSIYGSSLKNELMLPDNSSYSILHQSGLEKYPAKFWNHDYEVYARTWLPTGALYDDYQFVINKVDPITFDTKQDSTFSILSYNTQLMPFYANVADDLNNRTIRSKDIPDKITQYDVVVMEELFDHDLRNTVIDKMKANYPYHTKVIDGGESYVLSGGVMIFSKWPIVKEDQIVYKESTGWDSYASKGAVYAEIQKNGKIYNLIGTHLQAGGGDDGVVIRQKQLQEIANLVERLNIPADQPLMFAGDFNIDQQNKALQSLLATLQVNLVENTGYPYSSDGTIDTMNVGGGQSRIDYIFYSTTHAQPKIALNKVYILRDLDNEKMWPKFDLSDHFPIAGFFDYSN